MKKLLILSLIFLCLLGWSSEDWYSFLHKKVEITTSKQIYIGVVDDVISETMCMRWLPFGICQDYYTFCIIFLTQEKKTIAIRAEAIIDIKNLEDLDV